MLGTRPQLVGVFLLRWPQHATMPRVRPVQLPPTCAPHHSAPTCGVCKSRNSFGEALFTQGLMALVPPTICCVRAQSAREFVTEFSGGAT
jgi:hypothetical protein